MHLFFVRATLCFGKGHKEVAHAHEPENRIGRGAQHPLERKEAFPLPFVRIWRRGGHVHLSLTKRKKRGGACTLQQGENFFSGFVSYGGGSRAGKQERQRDFGRKKKDRVLATREGKVLFLLPREKR